YAISIGLLIGCFFPGQPEYAALGVLIMAWGDGLAALIGRKWGKHPYQVWGSQKSWEGSLTMTVVSFLITLLILGSVQTFNAQITAIALVIAMIATLLETFSKWGIDNLSVPVGTALVAWLLMQ
ncbi:MAG: diacylglycerol/polyprenol kinase family protein, partial [Microcystaceae cyanobacterium]